MIEVVLLSRTCRPRLAATRFSFAVMASLASVALVGGVVKSAEAQTLYTDAASFGAAAGSLTTFTFAGFTTAGSFTRYPSGLTSNGVTFTASDNHLYVDDPTDGNGAPFATPYLNTDAGGNPRQQAGIPDSISVALPAGTTAFGADFSIFDTTETSTVTIVVNGTSFSSAVPGNTDSQFLGVVSSVPITSLVISNDNTTNSGPALDNVRDNAPVNVAAGSTAPEPTAFLLIAPGAFGLLGTNAIRRRRKVA